MPSTAQPRPTRAVQPPPSAQPPTDNLAPRDVEALAAELAAYHAHFAPLFRRAEQRQQAAQYLAGQLLDLERKSIEPMARALPDGNVQALQQFIGLGAWDDEAVLRQHQRLVAETLGDPATGVLIVDGCDFPKQGRESVGVARQWCGALGKVANCQASVVAGYASARGYTLVDRRLYLPEKWFGEDYRQRRRRCGVPTDVTFRTRPALAGEMIAALRERGALPFRWVTADEHFGLHTPFLDRVTGLGLHYFAEVPRDTRVWLTRPRTAVPPAKPHGRPPRRMRVVPGAPAPVRVEHLAAQVPADAWRAWTIKEGAKGPLVAEFAFLRAVAVRDDLPGPDVWVVLRRRLDDPAETKVYLSSAPAETAEETLVWLSGMRWPVESAIQESKSELGLDHYEGRGWVGWHHHTTMTLLAHHFLVRLRGRVGGKGAGAHRAAGAPAAPGHVAPPAA
jgi:SRSO17 transposase